MMESIKSDPMNIGGYTPEPVIAMADEGGVIAYDANTSAVEVIEKAEDDRSGEEIAMTDNIDSAKDLEEDMDLYDMKKFSL